MPKIDHKTTKTIMTFLAHHWWKVIVITLALGVALSGFTCPTPWGNIEKTKVYEGKK